MPEFPDVVRAPPERVWRVLTHPEARRKSAFIVQGDLESGRAGAADAVALFRTKRAAWRERVLQAEAPHRLLVEQRDPDTDRTQATMSWRVEPIQLGSLVVLEVQGKGFGEAATIFAWRHRWYRNLVRAVKEASEAPEGAAPEPVPEAPATPPVPVETEAEEAKPRRRARKKK